jgi:TolB-like protein/DNA-binding winged helix-turn-helix (wHTH) protein/Tfp pilus assembly protein PilF
MATRLVYEFGEFRLDAEGHLLLRRGKPVPLTPKALDVVVVLVKAGGSPVTKDDLLRAVWADATVEEGSLTSHISILRKALGESAECGQYIETLPKRGYRFFASVIASEHDPLQAPAAPSGAKPASASLLRARTISLALTGIAVLLVLGYFATKHYLRRPQPGRLIIVVLPFQNLTGDPSQEFVSDGLTEEMITRLGEVNYQQLGVIARTSAMTYKTSSKPIDQIGRELGVDYILEGSVRTWGKRVRVTAQLIQVSDQTHLWSESYEKDSGDILKLESEVAQRVVSEISLALTSEQRARIANAPSVDPQVYELCLLGRYQWNRRTGSSLKKAIEYFRQAIGRDENYAPAYAGLAQAYAVTPYYDETLQDESFAQSKAAAERALRLDERIAEAHATLGLMAVATWDWDRAKTEYDKALEMNPNYATAHHWHSFYLWERGDHEEALAELERARQLDPLSMIIRSDSAKMLYIAHQFQPALDQSRKAIELDSDCSEAHKILALVYTHMGQSGEAVSEARKALELNSSDGETQATLGYAYAIAGRKEQAEQMLALLRQSAKPGTLYFQAYVHMGLGQREKTLECLEKSQEIDQRGAHGASMTSTGNIELDTPIFDPLHTDPRYQELRRRKNKQEHLE